MKTETYAKFQAFQCHLFNSVDEKYPVEELFGNELFQQMANTAFEIFVKYEKSDEKDLASL